MHATLHALHMTLRAVILFSPDISHSLQKTLVWLYISAIFLVVTLHFISDLNYLLKFLKQIGNFCQFITFKMWEAYCFSLTFMLRTASTLTKKFILHFYLF